MTSPHHMHDPAFRCGMRQAALLKTFAVAAMLAVTTPTAHAELKIHGTPDAVRIEARDASIDEILAALARSFDVQYQSSTQLERKLTGTYEGSLRRVLARLLEGHNFVLRTKGGRADVTVFATRTAAAPAATAAQPSPSPPAAAKSPASALEAKSPKLSPMPSPAKITQGPVPTTPLPGIPMPVPQAAEGSPAPQPVLDPSAAMGPELRPATIPPPMPGPVSPNAPEPPMPMLMPQRKAPT